MSPWPVAAVILLVGGFVPALWTASRGGPLVRLVGLQFATVTTILVLLLLGVDADRPSYLIVPLVLAAVACTGTLVYTRLLVRPQ